ncbi:ABC transporter substrate-binding protein [Vallitalea sp.]|uniref:ABC transporter substrate-binding protein n=1 Tax=Vallitalea sp. TaxID=1882829 RepID=UPI0025DF23C1|nr:ABC transporter substrate-binding protein [Vallitalea sp.]MCT4686212.1 ABC transporter substrate-binding protein [Vallitalea sp.]
MKRCIIFLLMIAINLSIITGCSTSKVTEKEVETDNSINGQKEITVKISGPKSPAIIPLLRIIDTNGLGENVKIELNLYHSMEEMVTLATDKDNAFMALPAHTASVLYNKDIDIKLLNVGIWGCMYLTTIDAECKGWEDLKGGKLYIPGKNSPPDMITKYFLKKNNLEPGKDLEIVYSNHTEIAQLLELGNIKHAIDAEPFTTLHKETIDGFKVISDYSEEWKKTEGEEYKLPAFGIVVNGEFAATNKEIVDNFNKSYEQAVKWTNENPEQAELLAINQLKTKPDLIEKAIPNMSFIYESAETAKKSLEKYFNILVDYKAETVGGKIPDETFYYKH